MIKYLGCIMIGYALAHPAVREWIKAKLAQLTQAVRARWGSK